MSDDNWGAAEPIRQSLHDLVSKFTGIFGKATPSAPQTDHDKAVEEMNKQAADHKNDAANASFAAAQAKMKGTANSYDSTKKNPLSSYSK